MAKRKIKKPEEIGKHDITIKIHDVEPETIRKIVDDFVIPALNRRLKEIVQRELARMEIKKGDKKTT